MFFVPVGLAVVGFACPSSCVRGRGFPVLTCARRLAVLVPRWLFCCGVCGGLLCVARLLACASGVAVFCSCRAGALSGGFGAFPARVVALRPWPWWLVCALLASSSGRFCCAFPCRLAFGLWAVGVSRCGAFGRQARFAPVCPCCCLPVYLRLVLRVLSSGLPSVPGVAVLR